MKPRCINKVKMRIKYHMWTIYACICWRSPASICRVFLELTLPGVGTWELSQYFPDTSLFIWLFPSVPSCPHLDPNLLSSSLCFLRPHCSQWNRKPRITPPFAWLRAFQLPADIPCLSSPWPWNLSDSNSLNCCCLLWKRSLDVCSSALGAFITLSKFCLFFCFQIGLWVNLNRIYWFVKDKRKITRF